MLASAIMAALGLSAVGASHPAKRNTQIHSRGVANLNAFRLVPMSSYTNAERTIAKRDTITSSRSSNPLDVAKAHVKDKNPDAKFRVVDDHYTGSNGITHIRFKQTMHDIDIDNADYNVNVRG